jgi:hypothetical protein
LFSFFQDLAPPYSKIALLRFEYLASTDGFSTPLS